MQPSSPRKNPAGAGTNSTSGPKPESIELNLDDLLSDSEWAELQNFFLGHLRGHLDEMDAWLRRGDYKALARAGHGLKGSGGGVGFPRFTELGRELETAAEGADATGLRAVCLAIRQEYLRYRPEDAARFDRHFES